MAGISPRSLRADAEVIAYAADARSLHAFACATRASPACRSVMRLAFLALALAAAAAPASAEPNDPARMVADDCARARRAGKTCVLDVAAEDVGGSAPTADDIHIRVATPRQQLSLIRLRRDFLPEIVKTAEDL